MSPAPQTAMLLTQTEWDAVANICRFYLRVAPPALPNQRDLAERLIDAARL